jgi:GntR family transcriptional regulator
MADRAARGDRSPSHLPLYSLIASVIRAQIADREWMPGEQIPPEAALARVHQVSVMTVRQALALLVEEGLLRRYQGKGTFVADDAALATEVRATIPLERILDSVATSRVEPIDIQSMRGPLTVAATLGVPAEEPVIRVRRVRYADEAPISFAISYLPKWLGGELQFEDLREPWLIALLERRSNVRFEQAVQTIEATLADPESAEYLRLSVGTPLLLVHRDYELADRKVAYVAINRYPSHLYRYRMLLTRQGPSVGDWEVAPVSREARG